MATSGSSILANWTLGDVNWLGHCQESAKVGIFWGQKKVPYEEFVDVLRFIAPNPFNYASRGTIVDWVDSFPRENISLVLREIRFECERDYCRSLIWEGNEDLAGIGIFVSYIIEIVLATFFFIILGSAYALGHRPYGEPVVDAKSRLWAAIQTSVGLFWDTALLFGLAVTVAALVSTKTSGSWYDNVFATLSSSISVSVVLLTWPLYHPTCRHRTARWAAICVLAAINSSLLISWLTADDLSKESQPFEIFCAFWHVSEGNTYGVAEASYYYSAIILASLSLALVAAYACYRIFRWVKKNRGPRPTWASTTLRILLVIWCGLMFTLMYTTMMSLALFRYTAAKKAGASLRENDWGFSQVMALATWLPTALDFILIFKGHLEAIRYRLPLGVDVQLQSRTEMLLSRSGTGFSTGVLLVEESGGLGSGLASPRMSSVEKFPSKKASRESLA